jgi:hypothetical protein
MKTQIECPLLNLIQTLNELTDSDQEVVTLAVSLVNSGRVHLCGTFADAKIKLSQPLVATSISVQERRTNVMRNPIFIHRMRRWLLATSMGVVLAVASSGAAQEQLFLKDLDHLKCYQVVKDPNRGSASVDLVNPQFGQGFDEEKGCKLDAQSQLLCVPTSKEFVDGEPVGDDPLGEKIDTDFLCYKLQCPRNPIRELPVVDQFGERVITVRNARFLCTPTVAPLPNLGCDQNHPPMCGGFCAAGTTCQPDPLGRA